jgi:hypothetical protein
MIQSNTVTLLVAPLNECISAVVRQLNTIKDLPIAAEGKVQKVIDGYLQVMTGNQEPHTNMAMPRIVNMIAPFPGALITPSTPVPFQI